MLNFNKNQLQQINQLNPLFDSKFKYDGVRWEKLNYKYKALVSDFIDLEISRKDVINAFEDYYSNPEKDVIRPFLLAMIWGFADTGYGWHRTNNYISSQENIELIKMSIDQLKSNKNDGLKMAFNNLKKIKGLGVSYLTKVLYFATRALKQEDYALIFDIRVASSLILFTTPKELYEIVSISPSSKYIDYSKFNKLMHSISKENNINAENLEMFLFDQKF